MGKHTWEGWQTSVSDAPQPTSIIYGANLRANSDQGSTGPEAEETDHVLLLLKKFNLPLTRENYLGLAYPDGLPEGWGAEGEEGLPEEIRKI